MNKRFTHSGDYGDCVASLPAVRHLGGGRMRLVNRPWTANIEIRASGIIPLLESQPYVHGVDVGDDGRVDEYDFSTFRQGGHPWGETLGELQAKWVGIPPGTIDFSEPWLSVRPVMGFEDKVVITRSPRYGNHTFPWRAIVDFVGRDAVFLGSAPEHGDFCNQFGKVEHVPTPSLLDVAGIISGCHTAINNQSSPANIAEGLKVRRIQETCTWQPDVIYGGGEVQYVADGGVTITHPRSGDVLELPPWGPPPEINREVAPPGLWQYAMPNGDIVKGNSFEQAVTLASQAIRQTAEAPSRKEVEDTLISQTCARLPGYGYPRWFDTQRDLFSKIKQLANQT